MDEDSRSFRFPFSALSPCFHPVTVFPDRVSLQHGRVQINLYRIDLYRIDLYGLVALRFVGLGMCSVCFPLPTKFATRAAIADSLLPGLGRGNHVFDPLALKRVVVLQLRFAALG